MGLADDILGPRFPVGVKAAGQLVAALVLLAADIRISFLPADWMNAVVTLLWVVGITNAFNLLDNMDGLSAGVALVASAVLLINAWFLGEFFISLVLVAFMGSLLGFLRYNWNPASIFLGDCGSLFIGYVLASLTLLERYVSHASSSYFPILMPVLVLAVPLLDTATVDGDPPARRAAHLRGRPAPPLAPAGGPRAHAPRPRCSSSTSSPSAWAWARLRWPTRRWGRPPSSSCSPPPSWPSS